MRYTIPALWALVIAGMLVVSSGRAKAPPAAPSEPPASENVSAPTTEPSSAEVPACLRHLDLTAEQEVQVKAIVSDYDDDLTNVWKQFSGRYIESIRTEALLLAAIEDNLTAPQRQQVREQRRRVAQHEKKHAAVGANASQTATKPVSAVETELAIIGVSLTTEQEAAADKVQEKYLMRLRRLNRDIQGLHTRLVSLEADKFVEIEKVLTKSQMAQLCELRQSAPMDATEDPVNQEESTPFKQ